jgi:hypothetical protein
MAEVITQKQAQTEVGQWLAYKKLSDKERESLKESIDELVDYMVNGDLALDENKNFIHTLRFPTEGEKSLTTLTYMPRIDIGTLNNRLDKIKSLSINARMLAYGAALTNQTSVLLGKLDTADKKIMEAIIVFFL